MGAALRRALGHVLSQLAMWTYGWGMARMRGLLCGVLAVCLGGPALAADEMTLRYFRELRARL